MVNSVKTQAVVQARVGSTRLSNKIFLEIGGHPLLWWVLRRLREAEGVDRIVIATSLNPADAAVMDFARSEGIPCHRGPEEDVLKRFAETLALFPAENVIRVTADNPLLDAGGVSRLVSGHIRSGADHTSFGGVVPMGSAAEAASSGALFRADAVAEGAAYREHVTSYIYSHPEIFRVAKAPPPPWLESKGYRLTVDTGEDLDFMRAAYEGVRKRGEEFDCRSVISLVEENPALLAINSGVPQKDWRDQLP